MLANVEQKKRRVLFFCPRSMYADESLVIGRALATECDIEPIYFGPEYNSHLPATKLSSAAGLVQSQGRSLKERLLKFSPLNVAATIIAVREAHNSITSLLDLERPDAIVVFDDRHLKPDAIALRIAKARGIGSVLAPYALSSYEADLYLRRNDAQFVAALHTGRFSNRIAALRHPEQVREGRFFYPAAVILALGAIGELPSNPWTLGANGADSVCTLTREQSERLIEVGVPAERITVTGQATTDELAISVDACRELVARVRGLYGLRDDLPIVMCAVPQHAEHAMTSWHKHRELTERLFEALASCSGNVLLSLHPKSERTYYAELAATHGLAILNERLSSVLPAADLFVAAFSSTVRWAIGLDIPTFVVDALSSGYAEFRTIPGVTLVHDYPALIHQLRRACTDPGKLNLLRASAHEGSARVGKIDGKAAIRIAQVIASTTTKSPVQFQRPH